METTNNAVQSKIMQSIFMQSAEFYELHEFYELDIWVQISNCGAPKKKANNVTWIELIIIISQLQF